MQKDKKKQEKDISKYFLCKHPGCGKFFRTKFSMTRHTLTHNQEKKFECSFCHKKFSLEHNMKEHTNTHTNEKPFVCGVDGCQERFRQSGKLSLHRRTHPGFALKEYTPNSDFNKKVKVKASARQQEKETSMKGLETQKKRVITRCPEQNLLRQGSGATNATVSGNNEPILHKETTEPQKTGLTQKALEEHDKLMELTMPDGIFKFYLELMPNVTPLNIRPVLPIPEKISIPNSHEAITQLKLFELLEGKEQ